MMEDAVHFLSKETVIQAIARSATKVNNFVMNFLIRNCGYKRKLSFCIFCSVVDSCQRNVCALIFLGDPLATVMFTRFTCMVRS